MIAFPRGNQKCGADPIVLGGLEGLVGFAFAGCCGPKP